MHFFCKWGILGLPPLRTFSAKWGILGLTRTVTRASYSQSPLGRSLPCLVPTKFFFPYQWFRFSSFTFPQGDVIEDAILVSDGHNEPHVFQVVIGIDCTFIDNLKSYMNIF